MNISSINQFVASNCEKVKTSAQACYATPLGKILLGFTALGITAYSAHNALSAEGTIAKVSHAAIGALGTFSAAFLAKEFVRDHGDDLKELRKILGH